MTRSRRDQVVDLLKELTEPVTVLEVARRLDVHPNTARFHLEALVESGRVERAEAAQSDAEQAAPGRPPLLFRIRRGMDPGGPRNYELLAGILLDGIFAGTDEAAPGAAGGVGSTADATARVVAAGRSWGRRLVETPAGRTASPPSAEEAVDRLVELLDDLGFAPERRGAEDEAGSRIGLRHCPFLELAGERTNVVCPIHLGLMQGAMDALSDEVVVEELDAFVEPDLCLTHLGRHRGPRREEVWT